MDIAYQIPRHALLWILAAVILVVLPQSLRMPLWVTVTACLCIGWRWLIFRDRLGFPGRPIRVLAVIFTLLVSASQMRNLGVGLDSAASLLTLGFSFKLIEMRYKRDIYVIFALCFVMLMVAFLYSQSAVSTIYIALVVLVITGAMIALNRSADSSGRGSNLGLAVRMMLQAVPLTIVLFLLFPRIAPLWAVPIQNSAGATGVTDEMAPGDISQLGRSADLAFRVKFENSLPPLHENLYWRGLVLDEFDGRSWSRQRSRSSYGAASRLANFQYDWRDRVATSGDPLRYNVILEPTQQPWIFGLHLARPESRNLFQSRDFEIFNNGLITQRLSYDLQSYREHRTDLILLGSQRQRNTELPETGNPASLEFARQLRASVSSDRDYVYQVLAYFQQNEFFYTLNPALLGQQRIDDFLFNTRQGFCEHYASSFAFLMRAAGIPTRVIVGYQGAEYNRFEDYMMVYQYNAHAWNEVWLDGEGWVRFDPTAAVSPERIQLGVEAALRDDPAFMEESLFSAMRLGGLGTWINTLRLRLDAIEYEWNRRVVNYDEDIQFDLFTRLLGEVTEQKVLLLMSMLAALVVFAVALTVIRWDAGARRQPADRLYRLACAELARLGLERGCGEGPLSYRDRVVRARPELAQVMDELTGAYVDLAYVDSAAAGQLRRQDLQPLKAALSRLRPGLAALLPRLRRG